MNLVSVIFWNSSPCYRPRCLPEVLCKQVRMPSPQARSPKPGPQVCGAIAQSFLGRRRLSPGLCASVLPIWSLARWLCSLPLSVNWVHPLSSFSEGGIWVEGRAGDTVLWARGRQRSGSILPVANGPVTFNSQKLHKVMPWRNGPRSVIVAFTPARLDRMPASQRQLLMDAGFRLGGNKHPR